MSNEDSNKRLIDHAVKGKHNQFKFIRNRAEEKSAYSTIKAFEKVVKGLKEAQDNVYNKYCNHLREGNEDFRELLVFRKLRSCKYFYMEEIKLIKDELAEFNAYTNRHKLKYLFGVERAEEDLIDYRNI